MNLRTRIKILLAAISVCLMAVLGGVNAGSAQAWNYPGWPNAGVVYVGTSYAYLDLYCYNYSECGNQYTKVIGQLVVAYDNDGGYNRMKATLWRVGEASGVRGYTYVDICIASNGGSGLDGCNSSWSPSSNYGNFIQSAGPVWSAPYGGNALNGGYCVAVTAYMQLGNAEAGGSGKWTFKIGQGGVNCHY